MSKDSDKAIVDEIQANILAKLPKEIVELVGRHSTHWNYTKMETLDALAELLAQRSVVLPEKEKEEPPQPLDDDVIAIAARNYNWGWNAAIDATAKLNPNSKGEV